MVTWQCDFYRLPISEAKETQFWGLFIYDLDSSELYTAKCLQSEATAAWLVAQLPQVKAGNLPEKIQIFRPQIVGLFETVSKSFGIKLETTRRTLELKSSIRQYIADHYSTQDGDRYLALDQPPPQPLPESLWGENWSFVSITAREILIFLQDRPIPIQDIPESLLPINLGIASNVIIPGIVVYGGKNSLLLCRWLQEQKPVALNYIPTEVGRSGGLVLESGLIERWIFNTFEDQSVAQSAKNYEAKKQESKGLHFLLIQPDASGMTYTGFWLLKEESRLLAIRE
ncbi:MAG TPA: Tab2 family RNA-binding protein [Xenococcaceae cyanobacterium]|jgi:hypothetical protein